MKLYVFTVYDKAVNAFMQPFYCRSKGEAIRSFTEACNDEKGNFGKYPLDYSLMVLGEFEDASGTFTCHEPERIIAAHEIVGEYKEREEMSPRARVVM